MQTSALLREEAFNEECFLNFLVYAEDSILYSLAHITGELTLMSLSGTGGLLEMVVNPPMRVRLVACC